MGNSPPEGSPFLIAVDKEGTRPGVRTYPQLPFHARFQGHLGDPAFARCQPADRIFFVDKVVKVYEQEPPDLSYPMRLPADYKSWSCYHDGQLGFSVPHPADWSVERVDDLTTALHAPQGQEYTLTIGVHGGETHYDEYNPSAFPTLMQGNGGMGIFSQDHLFSEENLDTQHLDGYSLERDAPPGEHASAVLLSGGGHTYELTLRFPTGFEVSQRLLTTLTAMVAGFRLDAAPGPSPTPPIKQVLGKGPFISLDEAVAKARKQSAENFPEAQNFSLVEAKLLPEAQARRDNPGCNGDMEGHFDGIWMLKVKYTREGSEFTSNWFLNATNGEWLCGEEISSNATPFPITPPPGAPTPAPTPTRVSELRREGRRFKSCNALLQS